MAPTPGIAAALAALALLLGEQGLRRSTALRHVAGDVRGLAKLCIGMLLAQVVGTALLSLPFPHLPTAVLALLAALPLVTALWLLLHRSHGRDDARAALPWLAACLAAALAAPVLAAGPEAVATDRRGWLLLGCGFALALAPGLPAFAALARQFDGLDTPAPMRGLPAQAVAAGVIALALAGMLAPW